MKVKGHSSIDVTVEVDVDVHDVLRELSEEMAECCTEDLAKRVPVILDHITRILASATDEMIAAMKPEHAAIVRDRLVTESARYPLPVTTETACAH